MKTGLANSLQGSGSIARRRSSHFLLILVLILPGSVGAWAGDIVVYTEAGDKVLLSQPNATLMAGGLLFEELVNKLELVVLRGSDGLLRAVALENCVLVERINRSPPRFAVSLRDGRRLEGVLLTGIRGRDIVSDADARIDTRNIRRFFWSDMPPEDRHIQQYFGRGLSSEPVSLHLTAARGRVPFELELSAAWFGFFGHSKPPYYESVLSIGRPELWSLEIDLSAIQQVSFIVTRGEVIADVRARGQQPFRRVKLFSERAKQYDLEKSLYVFGLDRSVLIAVPIGEVEALSRRHQPRKVLDDSIVWEVAALDGDTTRQFTMVDVQPVYNGTDPLYKEIVNRLEHVTVERASGAIAATTASNVRRAFRRQDEMALVVMLKGEHSIEGVLRSDLLGRTQYGMVHVHARAVVRIETSNKGDMIVGYKRGSTFLAQVLETNGARHDLEQAIWMRSPTSSEPAGEVDTSNQLTVFSRNWADRVRIDSILAVTRNLANRNSKVPGDTPHSQTARPSTRWRVETIDGTRLFGRLSAVPEFSLRELWVRGDRWSLWIAGVKGAAIHLIPMRTVSSMTFNGKRRQLANEKLSELLLRPGQRRGVQKTRPILDVKSMDQHAYFKILTQLFSVFVLEVRQGVYAFMPMGAIEKIEPEGDDLVRVYVAVPHIRESKSVVGRPITSLEGDTTYGITRISPQGIAGYKPLSVGSDPPDPWVKLKTQIDLQLTLWDNSTLDFEFVFIVDEINSDSGRRLQYPDSFMLLVKGVQKKKKLAALQEIEFMSPPVGFESLYANVRVAGSAIEKGELLMLSGKDSWSSPDPGDFLCGVLSEVIHCVEIRKIRSLRRLVPSRYSGSAVSKYRHAPRISTVNLQERERL